MRDRTLSRNRKISAPGRFPAGEACMEDDFDDDAVGMPDDDLTGGGDLGDLDIEGEATEVEIDLEGGEPAGRAGGGARARSKAAKAPKAPAAPKAAAPAATKKAAAPA